MKGCKIILVLIELRTFLKTLQDLSTDTRITSVMGSSFYQQLLQKEKKIDAIITQLVETGFLTNALVDREEKSGEYWLKVKAGKLRGAINLNSYLRTGANIVHKAFMDWAKEQCE